MVDSLRPNDPGGPTGRPTETGQPKRVLSATPARQGRYGRPVFWVLVISTLLAAIGLALAWGWKAPELSRPGSQQMVTSPKAASAFRAPEPAAQNIPPGTDHTSPGPPTPQTP